MRQFLLAFALKAVASKQVKQTYLCIKFYFSDVFAGNNDL